MAKHRIALGISYQGQAYSGWQIQSERATVQGAVEAALSQFITTPTQVICAGRTDTGVHAINQVVHLDTDASRSDNSWVRGVNAFLPPDIRIKWATEVAADFHARFDAKARTYIYILRNHPVASALLNGLVGWFHLPLDLKQMQAAATYLVGTHDFSSFRSSECQAHSPIRTIYDLSIRQQGHLFIFTVRGDGFLHHMVRNIVGSLVYVGKGKYQPEYMAEILAHRARKYAAPTFMADGLYLAHIAYPNHSGINHLMPELTLAESLNHLLNA
ncbi:tRNA pseudouridine(38-40) synthase TruA [Oligella urethralis]|uniref:tRNA pseudouridine synthase A n=1 Tax=Oligella urethralis DNF00040 TaxID=1401065 RepID=A0A095ZB15_9BURK|nr:tRNA pseudouridine(38-40) synthase TruA [Oligella urethralis]KGF31808.1 tRNA pseudouridine synthase A [Oligella urethralis DNF00040]MDK6202081.1 tRNA pseudouridine(38-40) synthase TruA [Oligella urethralis]